MRRCSSAILLLATLFLLASCVTDRSASYAPAGTARLLTAPSDPLEGYNRVVQDFNKGVSRGVVHPAAQVWRFLTPEFLRDGLTRMGENLGYPLRFVNHILQGDFSGGWNDTRRFVVNSTVGVLGFWDPATPWGLPQQDTSFGDTFALWGMGSGCYLNLPFYGPGTLRDALGKAADFPLNLPRILLRPHQADLTYAVLTANRMTREEPRLYTLFTPSNHYELFRLFASHLRNPEYRFREAPPPEEAPDPDESFGALLLAPQDPAFFYTSRQRRVRLPQGGTLPYTCYPTREADTLVILLPGIGSHRNSSEVTALAELFRRQGWDTLALSSPFLPDFFQDIPDAPPPGYLPQDTVLLAQGIQAALADYLTHYRKPATPRIVVMGYSLGGLYTLQLAALQQRTPDALPPVDRFLAINPPRDPMAALQTVDALADTAERWPRESRDARVDAMLHRLSRWMNPAPGETPDPIPPLTREESQLLIGFYMRLKLVETLQGQERRHPSGLFQEDPHAYFHRNNFFAECLGFPYQDYLTKLLKPWYERHDPQLAGLSLEEMAAQCRLDALEDALRAHPQVRCFQNQNDFLIQEKDLAWYRDTLGERCQIFPRGGHLGTMHLPEYQAAILQALQP
ncbi:MAG: MlaA family lipoprotein [Oligosphaeraceae bacterium]